MRTIALALCFVGACARQETMASPQPEVGKPAPAPPSSPSQTAGGPAASSAKDGNDAAGASADEDVIELRFRDASVPPPSHRSYVVTVTRATIRKTVDSYGDVISDDKGPFSSADFDALVAALSRRGVQARAAGAGGAPGCTGGTGRSLRVRVARRVVVDASSERCGGKDTGSLTGDLDGWVSDLGKVLPGGSGQKAK